VANEKRVSELDMFAKWKATQNTSHFQNLYKSMKNLIQEATSKASYGSNLPESAHKMWAAQSFYDSLRTFNPAAGASLHTHVYNSVHQKAKRLNYMYQNLGHIPEPRAMQVGLYQTEWQSLKDQLGREPSTNELADRLGWGVRDVANIQKEIHKDLALDEGTEEQAITESLVDEETLDFLYFDLTSEEQVVYDYIFGKHGKPKLVKANNKVDFDSIARRSGFSVSKARTIFNSVRVKLKKALEK
jgi:DNA-directed RNA polymerase specialized sigma subunit